MFEQPPTLASDQPSLVERLLSWGLEWHPESVMEVYRPVRAVEVELRRHGRARAVSESVDAEWRSFAGLLEAGADHLAGAREAYREQSRRAAVQARELAAFATKRPAGALDRPAEEVGAAAAASRAARPAVLTDVSEWAVDEVMASFALSSQAASGLLAESIALVQQLPATLEKLESGELSWAHARMLVEVLAPLSDEARAAVEARLLSRAAGKTLSQLRAAAHRAVLRADASAATRRLAKAIRERGVRAFPGRDGMSTLSATLPTPLVQACMKALEGYADECVIPGDPRTKEQRMADCFVDLFLRRGADGESPVRIDLTVVAGVDTMTGGDEPGEIDGQPIPAAMVRELAYALGLLPRPAQPDACGDVTDAEPTDTEAADTEAPDTEAPDTGATAPGATDSRATDGEATEEARSRLADLLTRRTTAGTALSTLPSVAIVDELSGQLLALTSGAGILRAAADEGPGFGPPSDSPGYRPSAALQRFVRARDRRCRFPGCRAPAERCDLDHNLPWPGGSTSADNLCCLCRHHHRLSHQAPGWRMRRLSDGVIEWTTPGGERLTTRPLRYGTDDDLPPQRDAEPRGASVSECVLGRPATADERATDPPPF